MMPIGQRIADPRVLSEEIGGADDAMYSTLASYTFGRPADPLDGAELVGPLAVPDRTPRPSVFVSSHPSHGPATAPPDPPPARLLPDNASQHTFGRASRLTAADGAPSSPSSRSSSRSSMRTTEQYSSDDELDFDYYGGSSSPVTFARDDLVEFDHDVVDLVVPRSTTTSLFECRRGSLPMAIPGSADPFAARSREGSILTVRRPSRSWDESSVHRSVHGPDDPSLLSDPFARAALLSLEQQLAVEPDVFQAFDTQYIFSRHDEGSIRSFNSRLSFVQPGSAPHHRAIPRGLGSTTTLPFEDTFMGHIRENDRMFDALRFYWSFQREKADASSSVRRRQQAQHRPDKSFKEPPTRVQEMWRCGHIGRFKIDRLVFRPDPAKPPQHRIQIRRIPDPFLGNVATGPHSVVHKHSRAVAFSIFRSHGIFSGARHAGGYPMHMSLRSGTMLALKKVQEQYTSTKTVRQLGPFQSGDQKSKDPKDKENKAKTTVKLPSKTRSKDKGDKKRPPPTESAESSTATSSAGSVTKTTIQRMAAVPKHPVAKIQFAPSPSSSTTVYNDDSVHRPVSSSSSLSVSVEDSVKAPEGQTFPMPPVRHVRDHRDSIDSEDRLHVRTTHAEAFGTLDPNDIESLRAKAHSHANTDSGSTLERFLRVVFPRSSKPDDHSHPSSVTQPRAFQPPWMITAGRDQQEENDRVLDDLNASFRDVGLLHTHPHKSTKTGSRHKSREGVLAQIPDDCLYMLLPLWPSENDTASVRAEASSAALLGTDLQDRQFLLVYYVPSIRKADSKDKKTGKKKAKQSHSSDSGVEPDTKADFLRTFHVVARLVAYDELQLSGIRIPSEGLAISGPEWEAINHPAPVPLRDVQMIDTVVCQCESREGGFDFLEHGLLKLGLCTRDESQSSVVFPSETEPDPTDGKSILTPIGRAAVEMIWLGCLAITSFGST